MASALHWSPAAVLSSTRLLPVHFTMYFPSAFVIAVLPFLVAAVPSPAPRGVTIPLAKRSAIFSADGTVDRTAVQASIKNSVAKIQRGFAAFERNTGVTHSLAGSLKGLQNRQAGDVPLTDEAATLWYGTISVGTPERKFTGEPPTDHLSAWAELTCA
jgi:cathepsin D